MRLTVTVRGDFEEYIKQEMVRTGLSSAMVCLNLALSGMEYREILRGLSFVGNAGEEVKKRK